VIRPASYSPMETSKKTRGRLVDDIIEKMRSGNGGRVEKMRSGIGGRVGKMHSGSGGQVEKMHSGSGGRVEKMRSGNGGGQGGCLQRQRNARQ